MNNVVKHFSLWLLMMTSAMVQAQVVVNVSGGQHAASPIVVLPLQGDTSDKIGYIISTDLKMSGYFRPVDPRRVQPWPTTPATIPYQRLTGDGINYLSMGRKLDDHSAQFVLSDIGGHKVISNNRITGGNDRQIAHNAADLILQRLTGVRGAFGVPIAYVLEQDVGNGRRYSLIVSDIDGVNRREVFVSNQPIVSPKWSPDGHSLVFMTYANRRSQIMTINILTGARRVLVEGDDISSAPVFSPDGRYLAFSQSSNNNPEIFLLDLATGNKMQLTHHAGIDTEPTFSPDGQYIYFTSERSGSPQIYRMTRTGGNVTRVVVGSGYAASGDLSPDGRSLVLTRRSGGGFQIGLYDLTSGHFDSLTSGRLDEGASFAPNGQMIIYATRENGRSVLKIINRRGDVALTLSDPVGRLRTPTWAPDLRN